MKKFWLSVVPMWLFLACSGAQAEAPLVDDSATIHTQLAAEYYKRAQYSTAIDEAQKALAANGKFAQAYGMLAMIYSELREDGKARQNFQQAISLAPDNSDLHHNYGSFLCDRKEFQAGIAEFMQAVKNPLYTSPEKTLVGAGLCSEKEGKPDVARAYYEQAMRYAGNASAKFQLASLMFKENQIPEARVYALELVKTQNPQVNALWLVVRIEHKLGSKESELRYAEQLRRLYPDSLETSKMLAGQYD